MSKGNLSEDAKAKLLGKLREPASPILTQVVRVEEPIPAAVKPTEEAPKAEPVAQFNAQVPAELLKRARRHKADSGMTLNQIATEALMMYLDSIGAAGSTTSPR